ncbi:MAG: DUF6885 family protein [Candidatus Methanomethylicaceae archaeon]
MESVKVVPVKTTDKTSGPMLDMGDLEALVEIFSRMKEVQLIFNLNTKYLLDGQDLNRKVLSSDSYADLIRLGLRKRESVGHFVSCAGFIRKIGGGRTFFIIRDTYRRYGIQIQPFEAILQGINRVDGREGGILAIVPKKYEGALIGNLEGFKLVIWDNGTPF